MQRQSQPQNKTVGRVSKTRARRYISQEVWESHRRVIEGLFGKDLFLREIIEFMRTRFSFDASQKQYKTRFDQWQLRRNMKPSDVAYILQLIREGEEQGRNRKVFFFDKEKTKANIATYLKKTLVVAGESDLLQRLDATDTRPNYITFEDQPLHSLGPEQAGDTPRVVALPDPQLAMSHHNQTPTTDYVSPHEDPSAYVFVSQDGDRRSSPRTQDISVPLNDSTPQDFGAQSTYVPHAATMGLYVNQQYDELQAPFMGICEPLGLQASDPAFLMNFSTFNGFMSATSYGYLNESGLNSMPSSVSFPMLVQMLLGREEDVNDGNTSSYAKAFFRQCCEACLYLGQDPYRPEAEHLLAHTEDAFDLLLQSQHEWKQSLTVLSNLLTLFYAYGQVELSARICKYAYRAAARLFGSDHPITYSIEFMMSIGERQPGADTPTYDIDSLRRAHESLVALTDAESQLALSARYNLAWALTEVEQYDEALQILIHLRAPCEKIFGASQVQTISCICTLARVYLSTNQEVSAECLMRETVATRIEQNFSDSHPYFWEAKNRHALFLMKLENANVLPHRREQYLTKAEQTLREVLLWRWINLGQNNPRTTCTFRAMRRLLKKQQRMDEADGLYQWCTDATRPYYEQNMSQHPG